MGIPSKSVNHFPSMRSSRPRRPCSSVSFRSIAGLTDVLTLIQFELLERLSVDGDRSVVPHLRTDSTPTFRVVGGK